MSQEQELSTFTFAPYRLPDEVSAEYIQTQIEAKMLEPISSFEKRLGEISTTTEEKLNSIIGETESLTRAVGNAQADITTLQSEQLHLKQALGTQSILFGGLAGILFVILVVLLVLRVLAGKQTKRDKAMVQKELRDTQEHMKAIASHLTDLSRNLQDLQEAVSQKPPSSEPQEIPPPPVVIPPPPDPVEIGMERLNAALCNPQYVKSVNLRRTFAWEFPKGDENEELKTYDPEGSLLHNGQSEVYLRESTREGIYFGILNKDVLYILPNTPKPSLTDGFEKLFNGAVSGGRVTQVEKPAEFILMDSKKWKLEKKGELICGQE